MLESRLHFPTSALFLIYINDRTENLQSNPKCFADDNSFFTIINNSNATAKRLCEDLDKITEWTLQWKKSFNPKSSIQAQEVTFTPKVREFVHRPIFFNNKPVQQVSSQKLSSFIRHIFNVWWTRKNNTAKFSKIIGLLRKLSNHLSRSFLITISKSLMKTHLDFGDEIMT